MKHAFCLFVFLLSDWRFFTKRLAFIHFEWTPSLKAFLTICSGEYWLAHCLLWLVVAWRRDPRVMASWQTVITVSEWWIRQSNFLGSKIALRISTYIGKTALLLFPCPDFRDLGVLWNTRVCRDQIYASNLRLIYECFTSNLLSKSFAGIAKYSPDTTYDMTKMPFHMTKSWCTSPKLASLRWKEVSPHRNACIFFSRLPCTVLYCRN